MVILSFIFDCCGPVQTGRDAYLCAEYLWDGEYYVQEPPRAFFRFTSDARSFCCLADYFSSCSSFAAARCCRTSDPNMPGSQLDAVA